MPNETPSHEFFITNHIVNESMNRILEVKNMSNIIYVWPVCSIGESEIKQKYKKKKLEFTSMCGCNQKNIKLNTVNNMVTAIIYDAMQQQ